MRIFFDVSFLLTIFVNQLLILYIMYLLSVTFNDGEVLQREYYTLGDLDMFTLQYNLEHCRITSFSLSVLTPEHHAQEL